MGNCHGILLLSDAAGYGSTLPFREGRTLSSAKIPV